ncbi:RIKEN cDNA A130066N16, partial [Mus musculus]
MCISNHYINGPDLVLLNVLNSSHTSNNTVSIETNIFQQERHKEEADGAEEKNSIPLLLSECWTCYCAMTILRKCYECLQVFTDFPSVKSWVIHLCPQTCSFRYTALRTLWHHKSLGTSFISTLLCLLQTLGEGPGVRVSAFSEFSDWSFETRCGQRGREAERQRGREAERQRG